MSALADIRALAEKDSSMSLMLHVLEQLDTEVLRTLAEALGELVIEREA